MGRPKKKKLKRRKDGRFLLRYDGQWFYSTPWAPDESECYAQKEDYERRKLLAKNAESRMTVRQYAAKWLPRTKVGVADQTYNEAAALLDKLLTHIGNKPLSEVKPSDVKEVYSKEFEGLSNSYIRAGAQLYKSLFDAATEDGYCPSNPARQKSAQPHRGYEGGNRAITDQERTWIETLCTDHRAWPAVMAMLYAGIRPQEAKALNIDNSVDFDAGIVHVKEFVHYDGTNRYRIDEKGKSDNATREIPLFPPLRAALKGKKGMLVKSASGKRVTVQAWRSVWESYVWCMETAINGMQERWYRRTREHKKILAEAEKLRKEGREQEAEEKEAEIPPWIEFTVGPYDLRHSFCTMCRDANPPVEINTCIHWMGHADAKMILKIYDEFSTERSKKEAEKLEKTLFGSQNGSQNEE